MKEKLKEICESLESEELLDRLNWTKGAELVSEGLKIIYEYRGEDEEVRERYKYLAEQTEVYLNGSRSNALTRRIIVRGLAELDRIL